MKEERLIGNVGLQELRQQCLDLLEEIRQTAGVLNEYFAVEESQEFIDVILDGERKVVMGARKDGTVYIPSLYSPSLNKTLQNIREHFEEKIAYLNEYFEDGSSLEWMRVITDAEGKLLKGITKDGINVVNADTIFNALLSCQVISLNGATIQNEEDPEGRLEILFDADGNILSYRKKTGVKVEGVGFETPSLMVGGTIMEDSKSEEEYLSVEIDSEKKLLSYRRKDGTKVERAGFGTPNGKVDNLEVSHINIKGGTALLDELNLTPKGMTEFQQALKDSGFTPGGQGDHSDEKELHIGKPYCAKVNFIGITDVPTTKTADVEAYMEFWDMNGNYFKKEVIVNAQGNSTLGHPKRNISIDICNNNGWDDDDTFKLQIGAWVPQDSFQIKAFYSDPFRCVSPVVYELYDEILKTRGSLKDYVWKKALLDLDSVTSTSTGGTVEDAQKQFTNGAKCLSDGFPCIVYMEGEFYGIYAWQLKKHRDNYQMSKKKAKHIHLDGVLGTDTFFNHKTDAEFWTWFEVRNPKSLVYAEAHSDLKGKNTYKYDADNGGQFEIAGNSDGSLPSIEWQANTPYPLNQVVWKTCSDGKKHYFINTIADNEAEPIYNDNNADDAPDFKNKTGCGWINCTITVQVKPIVLAVSDLNSPNGELNQALATYNASEKTPEDLAAFREVVEDYFDAENLIDYLIISDIVNNYDGFRKNWQWITYDGKKWYICMWDCDGCLGNWWELTDRIMPPLTAHICGTFPYNYIMAGWLNELNDRYAELRRLGIISVSHIMEKVTDWLNRFGNKEVFDKEWERWPQFIKNDSILRLQKWVEETIENMDGVYGYTE